MSWKSQGIVPLLSSVAPLVLRANRVPGRVRILAYHRVLDLRDGSDYDEEVISASPELFEREVRFFKNNFQVMTFAGLRKVLDAGDPVPPGALIVTFDDGYADNFTHAFPILKKYGVPATIFLAVRNVETGEPYWWDEATFYMKSLGRAKQEIKSLLRSLKEIPNSERIARIKELSRTAGITPDQLKRQTMTWENVQEMSAAGIEFGSHTMTHPVLSRVDDEEDLNYEIQYSKKIIEEKLKKEVVVFSYPVGGTKAFNNFVKQKVKDVGYSFAVSYLHGTNDFHDERLDRYELKRLDMDKQALSRVRAKLAFPQLFGR